MGSKNVKQNGHWRSVEGYTRDTLANRFNGKKKVTVSQLRAEGKKLGLKEVTLKMKERRWRKEGRIIEVVGKNVIFA